jgi:hypothetical protein
MMPVTRGGWVDLLIEPAEKVVGCGPKLFRVPLVLVRLLFVVGQAVTDPA